MKKMKLTRSLLAACSIVALTAVMYGCEGGHSDAELADAEAMAAADAKAAAEAKARAEADAAAKAAAEAQAKADAAAKAAADAKAEAEAKARADAAARAAADAAASEAEAAQGAAEAAAAAAAKEAAAAAAAAAAEKAAADARAKVAADAAAAAKKAAEDAAAIAEAARKAQMEAEEAKKKAEADAKKAEADAKKAADARAQADADREKAEADKAKADEMKANADAGKALKKALGATPLANLEPLVADGPRSALATTGLIVHTPGPDNTAVDGVASPRMKPGDSAGSLGDWAGTNYAHTHPVTEHLNQAVVYTNQGPPTSKVFATKYAPASATQAHYTFGTAAAGVLAEGLNISGDEFPTEGTQRYLPPTGQTELTFTGKYDGAPGTYSCEPTDATGCSAAYNAVTGIDLDGGDWRFTPDTGAKTLTPDANYLYFGWWLNKDEDSMPTAASAFAGVAGTIAPLPAGADPGSDLSGSAKYVGAAAGKFAINDPLHGGDAGHFTADATLTATFGSRTATPPVANAGVTGTIDNFMANGEAVPWKVSLHGALWGTNGAFASTQVIQGNDIAEGTMWSIDGKSAAESGSWSGQMYDEMPGNPPDGDGSNVPTSVTGTFQSHFGSTHTMVGAFGAEHQEDN